MNQKGNKVKFGYDQMSIENVHLKKKHLMRHFAAFLILTAVGLLWFIICSHLLETWCQLVNLADRVSGFCLPEIDVHNHSIRHSLWERFWGTDYQGLVKFGLQAVQVYTLGLITSKSAAGHHSFKTMVEVNDRLLVTLLEGAELDLFGLPLCPLGCKVVLESGP